MELHKKVSHGSLDQSRLVANQRVSSLPDSRTFWTYRRRIWCATGSGGLRGINWDRDCCSHFNRACPTYLGLCRLSTAIEPDTRPDRSRYLIYRLSGVGPVAIVTLDRG